MKKGFTLAEIMIVLVVIGILTGILVPAAINSMPNENVMKFKKAHNTLYRVINELVNSDKYFLDGDLGIRIDGTLNDGTRDEDSTYFCEAFADVLSYKAKTCQKRGDYFAPKHGDNFGYEAGQADRICINITGGMGMDIITSDGIEYYFPGGSIELGYNKYYIGGTEVESRVALPERIGIPARSPQIICIDVDGTHPDSKWNECVNECPFGYWLQADGKIYPDTRAEEWLEKSIQDKE